MEVEAEAIGSLRFGVTKRELPKSDSAIAVGIAEMNFLDFLPISMSIVDDVGFRRFVDLLSDQSWET